MSNNAHDKAAQEEHFADIFARLREQDIEQFYAHYQLWVLRRRLPLIEKQLEALREHLAENQQATENLRPSALALAVLVRLQSNGVNDTDLLDLMLDRGEDWLDRMMQRLDYCEQVEDFIQGDYTQWCIKSLDGAYDWIDSLLGSIKENNGRRENPASNNATTEEQLLQKLSLDEDEDTLAVTLKQNATQSEAATEESGAMIAADATPANDEQELTPLPTSSNAEVHAGDGTTDQPELASPLNASAEWQEDDDDEPQPELFGWKDLEDLEAPEGHPLPWYSVNVTEDGTTSTPLEAAEQAATMNDWIKVLQADSAASAETGPTETAPDHATELPTSSDQAQAAEVQAPESTPDTATIDISTESEDAPTGDLEVTEQTSAENVQNDDEAISLVEAEVIQEQIISLPEETQSATESRDESDSEREETLTPEMHLDEPSLHLTENPVPETSAIENEAETTALNSEQGNDEADQLGEEHAGAPEELELASHEPETDEQAQVEENISGDEVDEEAPIPADATETEAESAEGQMLATDLPQAEDHTADNIATQAFAVDLAQAANDAQSATDAQTSALDPAPVEDEIQPDIDAHIVALNSAQAEEDASEGTTVAESTEETAPSKHEQAEANASEGTNEETAPSTHEQTEANAPEITDAETAPATHELAPNGESQAGAEESLPSEDAPVQQPEREEAAYTQKAAQEAQNNEIETAAIANDILSLEDDQEEQLAWYEYLDLEEPATTVAYNTPEEHSQPEASGALSPGKPPVSEADASPAIYEYAIVEERADDQASPLRPEEQLAAEAGAIEGWQSWSTPAGDDETLPLALKEIELAHQSQANNVPEEDTTDTAREPQNATASDEARAKVDPDTLNESAPPVASEASAHAEWTPQTWDEATLTPLAQSAPEAASASEENAATPSYQQASSDEIIRRGTIADQATLQMPSTPPLQTMRPAEPPPKKPGFWRRLFRFGRKNKR